MDKIKVSKDIAIALDTALKTMNKEDFFEKHSNKLAWNLSVYQPLNQISNWKMAQILINGYEVEETPHEKLLFEFNEAKKDAKNFDEEYITDYAKGFCHGVLRTLKLNEIRIEGIND